MAQATISSYPVSYTTSGSLKGTNYQNAIGKGADTASVSGNDYCSSRNSYAHVYYSFDFSSIPNNAKIISVECQVKGHAENTSQSSERARCQLYVGTSTAKGSYSDFTSTSAQTLTLTTGTWTYEEVQDMTLCFTMGYYGGLVNGATIIVTYELSDPRTITTTLSGNGTINPSGTQTMYDGNEYNLTIIPTNESDTVTATKDGTTIPLTQHTSVETIEQNVLGEYTLVSGGFNSGESWFEGRVGNGYDTSDTTTSNYYSSSSSVQAIFRYDVSFTGIPNDATIENLYMMVNGHAESTSNSNEYMCVQLVSGDTELSEQLNFKSIGTSNSTQTITANVTPTVSQLENLAIECTLGYYGGAINGATVFLTYSVSGVYYTYSTTISGDMSIAVIIGNVTTYTVNASSDVSRVTVTPTTQTQAQGSSAEIRFDTNTLNNIIVKDNNVDVTSQLVSHTSSGTFDTNTYIPSSFDSTNSSYDSVYSTNNPENGLTAHTSTTRCCVYANTTNGSESYLYYNFDCSDIPSNATITSVTCQVGASCYSSGSYFSTHTLQLCTGTTEKGTATTATGNGSTSKVETVNGGSSWTRAELDDIKIRFKIVRSQTGDASFSFFGATLTVEYTLPATTYWTYTISNLQTDHTVVVINASGAEYTIYIKNNGTWIQYSKIYKKVNGSWVEQSSSTWSTLFNTTTNYIHG